MSPDGMSVDEGPAEPVLSKTQASKKRSRSRAVAAPLFTGPCIGCRHEQRCKTEILACSALVLFRQIGASPVRLAYAPRFPSRELYERAHAPVKVTPAPARPAWGRKRHIDEIRPEAAADNSEDDWL